MQRSTTPNHGRSFAGLCIGGTHDGIWQVGDYHIIRLVAPVSVVSVGVQALPCEETFVVRDMAYLFHDWRWKDRSRERTWGFWVPSILMREDPLDLIDRLVSGYRPTGRG